MVSLPPPCPTAGVQCRTGTAPCSWFQPWSASLQPRRCPLTTVPSPCLGGADTAGASRRLWDGLAGSPAPGPAGPAVVAPAGLCPHLSSLQLSAQLCPWQPLRELLPSPELPHFAAHLSSSSVVLGRQTPRQFFPGILPRELSLMVKLPSLPFLLLLVLGSSWSCC